MLNAHVIGLGKSGIAAAKLLKKQGWEVTMSDRNSSESLCQQQQQLQRERITVNLGYSWNLDTSDLPQLVVVSPGVPWDLPALVAAREHGIETIGEMELAWRNLQSCPWVGITGTNGKTTTTALIAAIFQSAGLNAPACGNIGYAACNLALEVTIENPESRIQNSELDWVIAEISSYQIESSASISPRIGIWTTFTPDHLSRHQTLENYYNIKAHLLRQSQIQIFNGDDAYLNQVGSQDWADAYWTTIKGNHVRGSCDAFGGSRLQSMRGAHSDHRTTYIQDGWVVFQNQRIVKVSALRMSGEHNQQNLLMAVTAARLAGIDSNAIAQAIANFPGVPHRLEYICTWQRIDFINDSKATNYDAAQVGLSSVASPVILIAGGEAKAGDDTGWLQTIQSKAASVLLIGDAAPAFAQRLKQVGYFNYKIVETLDKAVSKAAELAPQYQARVVLLSPACASFDQYENFEQRGDHFRQLCQELLQ